MEKIFNEKYRPTEFQDVVGLDTELPKLVNQSMPHMLFVGSAGTGKTTTAKIIINKLNADTLILNASKDRGIDVIRDKIEPFASKRSEQIKIIFLDEFDATTPQFQTALRNFMETYSNSTRFIATCNYPNKIIDPLLSRFSIFNFNNYQEQDKIKRLKEVVENENIKISDETLKLLMKKNKDDIRAMLNFLNKNKDKEITEKDVVDNDIINKIVTMLKEDKWQQLRMELLDIYVDYEATIEQLESLCFNSKMRVEQKGIINLLAQKYQFEMNFSFNKELCFSAFLYELQKLLVV
jgi:replication factor C small subunit